MFYMYMYILELDHLCQLFSILRPGVLITTQETLENVHVLHFLRFPPVSVVWPPGHLFKILIFSVMFDMPGETCGVTQSLLGQK